MAPCSTKSASQSGSRARDHEDQQGLRCGRLRLKQENDPSITPVPFPGATSSRRTVPVRFIPSNRTLHLVVASVHPSMEALCLNIDEPLRDPSGATSVRTTGKLGHRA